MSAVEDRIRAYIAENILFSDTYAYPDDASFLKEGIVDSSNVLELVMFVEQAFGITVDDAELLPDNFDSVARMAAYVRRKAPAPVIAEAASRSGEPAAPPFGLRNSGAEAG